MTLVELKFRLQSPITSEQLQALAQFSNTYGLKRFHIDDAGQVVRFEYDASRLLATQVAHVLRAANIPVAEGMI
jgi:hypothetical protein